MSDPAHLEAAIADLESRRALLGAAVVDAAVATLRAQLEAARAQAAGPAAEPPRLRQLSILFADIAGSTALLQAVPADEALALVSPALERFAAVVREAGGEVLRFTGDGLKAAFGTQGTREDEAERAVRAGLAILHEATLHGERLRAAHGISAFGVRVGVHTGPVVLGGGVEADRTAMGHAVHLAARLEQAAPVGRLRISHETWSQVRGLFEAEPQPPLKVQGHDEPLATWIVQRALANADRAPQRGIDGVAPPMVGRAAEWQALLALFERCSSEGQPGVAWVIGEAGLGKTRLRRELLAATGASAAAVLQARAHPADQLQPYGLVRQQLTRWFGIADDLPAAAARERFVAALAPRLARDGDARARRLGHLLGLDFADAGAVQAVRAPELREQGFATWREALHSAAAGGPLLLVLDDLHWADAASLEFVQRLAAEPGAAMLLLLLARPALRERFTLPAPAPGQLILTLGPLPAEAGQALAAALLAAVQPPSAALQRLLVQRAAGNPFYMEELLRMLLDDGAIDSRGPAWRVDEARLARLRVPETLVGVLQARLDALPAQELAALQQASIVGPVFWDAALAAVDATAPPALPALQQRAFVAQRPDSAFANTAERAFHHALLHDVTYGTVLSAARRAGHARVAQWLAERMAGRAGEFLVATAEHFERAGDAAMAWRFYDRARGQAMNRAAYTEALALIDRALALGAQQPPRWRFQLLVHRTTALEHLGRGAEARVASAEMARLAEAEDDDSMRADVATQRMLQADHEGRPAEALALAREALACVTRDGRPVAAGAGALAHGELAWLALQRNDFDTVRQHIAAGIVLARAAAEVAAEDGGYAGYELQLRIIEMHALTSQDRHADAAAAIAATLRMLDAGTRPHLLDRLHLHCQQSRVLRLLGDLDGAGSAADAALALAARMEMPRMRTAALAVQAERLLVLGDAAAVAAVADEVEHICRAIGFAQHLPHAWVWRGRLALARGDSAAANAAWQQAEALYREQQQEQAAVALACERAALAPAEPAALAAVDAATQAGLDTLAPEALLACHAVLQATGDARAAGLLQHLVARLREQLAQQPDAATRQRLLQQVPHWRQVAALAAARGEVFP